MAHLYGDTLSSLRQPGDIDILVDCGRERSIEYAHSLGDANPQWDYKHLHLKRFKGIEVEMPVDVQENVEKVESNGWCYKTIAFGKHFLLVGLKPFLQAFVLAQVHQDFRDIVHFYLNPFEPFEMQVFVVPLRIRISQGVRVFNCSFPSAVDQYVYVSRLAHG